MSAQGYAIGDRIVTVKDFYVRQGNARFLRPAGLHGVVTTVYDDGDVQAELDRYGARASFMFRSDEIEPESAIGPETAR